MVYFGRYPMKKIVLSFGAFFLCLAIFSAAHAATVCTPNSTPQFTAGGNVFGSIAAQWNAYFGAKADINGGTLCSPTIDSPTFTGTLNLSGSTISGATFNNPIINGGTLVGTFAGTPSFGAITVTSCVGCTTLGGGTVTSVALTTPSWLSVSGSPVTTAGTLGITATSIGSGLFLASPAGSAGALSPRSIAVSDLPTEVGAGNCTNCSVTFNAQGNATAFSNGSGGGITWPTSTDLVISNGTSSPAGLGVVNGDCVVGSGGAWTAGACGGSSGFPLTIGSTSVAANSTTTTIAGLTLTTPTIASILNSGTLTLPSTTGTILESAGSNTLSGTLTVSGTENVTGTFQIGGTSVSLPISATNGGTGISNPTAGGILIANGASPVNLLAEVNGDCVVGTGGAWVAGACGVGGVTSVGMTVPSWLTVTGSPVTGSGTLAVTGTSEAANTFLAGSKRVRWCRIPAHDRCCRYCHCPGIADRDRWHNGSSWQLHDPWRDKHRHFRKPHQRRN